MPHAPMLPCAAIKTSAYHPQNPSDKLLSFPCLLVKRRILQMTSTLTVGAIGNGL